MNIWQKIIILIGAVLIALRVFFPISFIPYGYGIREKVKPFCTSYFGFEIFSKDKPESKVTPKAIPAYDDAKFEAYKEARKKGLILPKPKKKVVPKYTHYGSAPDVSCNLLQVLGIATVTGAFVVLFNRRKKSN